MPNPNLLSTEEANALVDLNPPPGQAAVGSGINKAAEYPTVADIDHWFTYHAPSAGQVGMYADLREAGRLLSLAIHTLCPAGADRTTAIRKVREAVMTANAAIACGGRKLDETKVAL